MAIALGGNSISKAYLGSTEIQKMYLGANLVFDNTAPPVSLTPIMTNFRVEDANKDRVYFDTPLGSVDGINFSDFTISGKNIGAVNTTDNYFVVTVPFTYFDNNTIRKEGTDTTVYNFTMEYITNNIAITEGTVLVKYVDGSVGSSGDGNTEGTAYKTLAEGMAAMPSGGGKLWVKAFNYGAESIDVANSGSVSTPNIIEGYKTTIGDLDGVTYYNYGDGALSGADAPLFDGGNRDGTKFLDFDYRSYWIVRNVQFQNYRNAIYGPRSTGIELNNCVGTDFGLTTANTGTAFSFADTQGLNADYIRVKNSIFINATSSLITIHGTHPLVDNCKVYCNEALYLNDNDATTDYYIRLNGSNGIVRNSLAHKDTPNGDGHAGHGIALKSLKPAAVAFANEYNLIDGCEVINIRGSYQVRHDACKNNVFKNSVARANVANRKSHADYCFSAAIEMYAGGSYNTFENIKGYDLDAGIIWINSAEEDRDDNIQFNTTIKNCTFDTMKWWMYGRNAVVGTTSAPYNNVIDHCTITNTPYKMWIKDENTFAFGTNWMRANIFNDVIAEDRDISSAGWSYNYNLWWNSWAISEGTNAITPPIDPDLIVADYTANDYMTPQATFNDIDVPRKDGIYYDKNGNERQDPTTVGGVMSPSEVAVEPPVEEYDFYVSATGTGDGLTSDTPMSFAQSQTTINSMTAGQSIAYKGGDEFEGTLNIPSKSNITLTSYGTGKAQITGVEDVTEWNNEGSNIWSADVATDVYQVFKNGSVQQQARYPKVSDQYATKGNFYAITTLINANTFVSNELIGFPDITGGYIQVITLDWRLESVLISAFNSSNGQVTLASAPPVYAMKSTSLFFVINHYNLLDAADEWFYNSSNNKLYVYATSSPTGITANITNGSGITINTSSGITIDNIDIKGYNQKCIDIVASTNISLTNLDVSYANNIGIASDSSSDSVTLSDSSITGMQDKGVELRDDNTIITRNIFEETGTYKVLTSNTVTVMTGIFSYGDGAVVNYNTINNVGLNSVRIFGQNSRVEKNFITNFCLTVHDGTGIDTWNNSFTETAGRNLVIDKNIILNDLISKDQYWYNFPIYLDDYSHDITVTNNVTSSGVQSVYLHNTKNISANNNTFYRGINGAFQIKEDKGAGTISNNVIEYNEMFSASTVEATFRTRSTNATTYDYGSSNFNKYWNPSSLDSVRWQPSTGVVQYSLANWQSFSGQDLNSDEDTLDWTVEESYNKSQLVYNASDNQATQSLVGTWYDLDGTEYIDEITLQGWEGKILIDVTVDPPIVGNIYPLDNAASPTPDEVNSPGSWTSSGANPLSTADQAINGTWSMRARLTGANATWYASCPVEVESGKTYNYSIWARREGTSNNARFRNWQGFDVSPDIGVSNQTWTEYTGTVTATSTGTAYIRVYPNVDAGAAQGDGVYFDDIVINE